MRRGGVLCMFDDVADACMFDPQNSWCYYMWYKWYNSMASGGETTIFLVLANKLNCIIRLALTIYAVTVNLFQDVL